MLYVCPIHVCRRMDRLTDRQVQFTRRLHDAYFHPSTDCSFRFDFDRFYSVPPRSVSFVAVRGCSFRAIQRHNLFYFRKLNGSIPTGMRRRRANGRRGESCKRRKNECERHRSPPWKFLPRYTNNFRLTEARGTVFGRNGRRSIPLSIDYLTWKHIRSKVSVQSNRSSGIDKDRVTSVARDSDDTGSAKPAKLRGYHTWYTNTGNRIFEKSFGLRHETVSWRAGPVPFFFFFLFLSFMLHLSPRVLSLLPLHWIVWSSRCFVLSSLTDLRYSRSFPFVFFHFSFSLFWQYGTTFR